MEIIAIRKSDIKELQVLGRMLSCFHRVKGDPLEGRYVQYDLPEGIKLDLFFAERDNWGNILLIRTGDRDFSKYMMGARAKEYGYYHSDGYLWHVFHRVSCPEELDVFNLLDMDFVQPENRTNEALQVNYKGR